MARGRIIDKDLYSHPELGALDINARYLFIGTVIFADDTGRLKADPRFLKAKIFPFDEALRTCSVKDWLDKLSKSRLIQVYAAGGQEYLYHPNWEKWQPLRRDRLKPSIYPPPSECQPDDNQATTRCQPSDRRTEPNLTEPKKTYPQIPADVFDAVWSLYPKKLGRKEAQRHFKATVKTEKDVKDIKAAIANYVQYIEKMNMESQYVKHGSTFFNNWRDWVNYDDHVSRGDKISGLIFRDRQ